MAKQILLVDDEVAICEALTAFLAEQGHQVRYATNGEGAVAQALHADLASVRPELKILVLTAYPSIDALQTATNLGVAGFLSKPLGISRPVELVAREDAAQNGGAVVRPHRRRRADRVRLLRRVQA